MQQNSEGVLYASTYTKEVSYRPDKVRAKLTKLGINQNDVKEAMGWARNKECL